MSSLKQKAKTLSDLFWENELEWNKWLRMGVTESKQVALAPKYQEKWVRLEDAQELEQRVKSLETDRDRLLESLEICTKNLNYYAKETFELKQKLQQTVQKIQKCRDSQCAIAASKITACHNERCTRGTARKTDCRKKK